MHSMTKSPVALARKALHAGQQAHKPYSCKYSPHRYTEVQLFAMLILRQFFKTNCRGVIQLLHDFSYLRNNLQLSKILHSIL
jgi:hypothetical protein